MCLRCLRLYVAEPVVEPVKMKTRRSRQPKRLNQVIEDVAPDAVPDIEDLVAKRMKAMRAAKELKQTEKIKSSYCSSNLDLSNLYIYIYRQNITYQILLSQ